MSRVTGSQGSQQFYTLIRAYRAVSGNAFMHEPSNELRSHEAVLESTNPVRAVGDDAAV